MKCQNSIQFFLNFQAFYVIGLNYMFLTIYILKCGCFQVIKVIFSLQLLTREQMVDLKKT